MTRAPAFSSFGGPGKEKLAAAVEQGRALRLVLPRSSLHIKLLVDNEEPLDFCLLRDQHMIEPAISAFGNRVVFIGREARLDRSRPDLFAIRRENARYYCSIATALDAVRVEKLIIFLATEPLEEFVVSSLPPDKVEIWEEGLMHYVDLEGTIFRLKRRAVQKLCGFHVRSLARSSIQKSRYRIRDRFREGSLILKRPVRARAPRDEILYIGQPLVSDGMVTSAVYVAGLAALAARLERPLRYLPHPREGDAAVGDLISRLPPGAVVLETDRRGVLEHCADWSYHAYLSPFSTALLDLNEPGRSYWVAGLVGLTGQGARLRRWVGAPISIPANRDALLRSVNDLRSEPTEATLPAPLGVD